MVSYLDHGFIFDHGFISLQASLKDPYNGFIFEP